MGQIQALQVVQNQSVVSQMDFNKRELEAIRKTVAKDATEDEFVMFMHLCKSYGLDPFLKEIWCYKRVKKGQNPKTVQPIIMTSRDGYLKIADRNPNYDGIVSDVVRKGDKYSRTIDGVDHSYGAERGDIIGAYALVYRNDRKYPAYVFAPFKEYCGFTQVWNKYPSAMILKVAESMALKRSFSISGLVTKEEMDYEESNPVPQIAPKRIPVLEPEVEQVLIEEESTEVKQITDKTMNEIAKLIHEEDDAEVIKLRKIEANKYLSICHADKISSLTNEQGENLIILLECIPNTQDDIPIEVDL